MRTSNLSAQTCRLRRHWSQLSTHGTNTRRVTPLRLHLFTGYCRSGWVSTTSEQQKAHLAGLVHDIGKIGLPPGLLEKAGPLTLDERRVMQTHSEIGERILVNVDTYSEIADIVRHHHERIDGNGYPDGLTEPEFRSCRGSLRWQMPYNAMTSNRPYREAMPSRVARMRLAQAVGTQFDTSVVAAFEAILATAESHTAWAVDGNSTLAHGPTSVTNACDRGRGLVAAELSRSKSRRCSRPNSELLVDVTDMDLDRYRADEESSCPISAFESPRARSASTSFSRGESDITGPLVGLLGLRHELFVPARLRERAPAGACCSRSWRRHTNSSGHPRYAETKDSIIPVCTARPRAAPALSERFFLVVLVEGADRERAVRCDAALYPDRGFECRCRDPSSGVPDLRGQGKRLTPRSSPRTERVANERSMLAWKGRGLERGLGDEQAHPHGGRELER